MKKGLWKKILLVMVVIALMAVAFPVVAAYEGHLIGIIASVEQPFTQPPTDKTARLATPEEIHEAIYHHGIQFPSTPNPVTVTEPFNVPKETCIAWIVTITIGNFTEETMQRVTVDDNFNAEVAIALWYVSQGTVQIEHGPNQYRIKYWELYDFEPGETATLQVIVWTQCNPGGSGCYSLTEGENTGIGPDCYCPPVCHQEFTSTGLHWLNESGAVMKWYEWKEWPHCDWQVQGSYETGPVLPVNVY